MSDIPGDPVSPVYEPPNPDNPDRAVVVGAGADFVVRVSRRAGSTMRFLSEQGTWVPFSTTDLTSWGSIVGEITDQTDLMAMFALYSPTADFAPVAFTGQYSSLTGLPTLGTVSPLNLDGTTSRFLRGDGQWAIPDDVNAVWGSITGNINAQADLMALLNAKAPINNPTFTGFVRIPTPPLDDNSDLAINSQWFFGQAFNSNPTMDADPPSSGDSLRWARGNHRHPSDTTRAPIDSPNFTGIPVAPNPPFPNDSQRLATTAYVTQALALAGGIPEAPQDGKYYVRRNAAWVAIVPGATWDNTGFPP